MLLIKRGLHACLIAAVACGSVLVPTTAAAQPALERKVKSAFMLNFARFISWPPSAFEGPRSAFRVCTTDAASEDSLRSVVAGKTVGNRQITIRSELSADCHMIYLPAGDRDAMRATLAARAAPGVLTVYEDEDSLDNGVIRFYTKERKIRFEIDRAAANAAQLTISSQLLRVATLRGED